MLKAYKYRIYPNKEQRIYFAKTFGCVRFVYNQMLADRIKSYEENKDLEVKTIPCNCWYIRVRRLSKNQKSTFSNKMIYE